MPFETTEHAPKNSAVLLSGLTPHPTTENPPSIQILMWPAQNDRRHELASQGIPRLLVVDAGEPPPLIWDDQEDWIRTPFDPSDLDARMAALVRRGDCGTERPLLDPSGLLWFRERWIAVPDAQLPIVQVLLTRLGEVVSMDELVDAYAAIGGSDHPIAIKSMIRRLTKRVSEIGIELHTVRGRGFLIDLPDACRLHPLDPA